MKRAYKTKLKLNNKERGYMAQCAGVSRWAYNWAVDKCRSKYAETGKHFHPRYDARKELTTLKGVSHHWLGHVPAQIAYNALDDLVDAYSRFFKGQNRPPTRHKKTQVKRFIQDS